MPSTTLTGLWSGSIPLLLPNQLGSGLQPFARPDLGDDP
jgi:hypothetical protein